MQSLSLRIIEWDYFEGIKTKSWLNFFVMKVALSSFQEVINRLCHRTQGDGQGQEVTQGINKVKLF